MTFLPRRVISLVLMVCFAGTPTLLLACAVTCVPGMMTHGAMSAATPDAAPAGQTSTHEHLHHAMLAGQPSARASHHPDATVAGTNLAATSTDVVGPGCCAHTKASATTATPASRGEWAALVGAGTVAVAITAPAVRDGGRARASLFGQSLQPPPSRSPRVLRI